MSVIRNTKGRAKAPAKKATAAKKPKSTELDIFKDQLLEMNERFKSECAEFKTDIRFVNQRFEKEFSDIQRLIKNLNLRLKKLNKATADFRSGALKSSSAGDKDATLIAKGKHNLNISFLMSRNKIIDILEPFSKVEDAELKKRYKEAHAGLNVLTKFYLDMTK